MKLIVPPFRVVEPVLVDEPASPFHGMTHSKAVLIRDTLWGYWVRLASDRDLELGTEPQEGIFRGMAFPGEFPTEPMQAAYDLVLGISARHRRIISPNIVRVFEVRSKSALRECDACGRWSEPEEMVEIVPEWREPGFSGWERFCRQRPCTYWDGE